VKDKACVRDGKVVVLPIMKIMATMDHRFVDGADGAQVAKVVKELLENPEMLDKD
jgi:pyruvate/2-oxoglutarate dehydrogenase complex dihydrolipoamide acyltransferase (E2) component